jgi:hypothetical protein
MLVHAPGKQTEWTDALFRQNDALPAECHAKSQQIELLSPFVTGTNTGGMDIMSAIGPGGGGVGLIGS